MKTRFLPMVLTIALFAPALAQAQAAKSPRASFDTFKMVRTRNVFDPDRRGQRSGPPPRAVNTQRRANYAVVTGAMVTEGKTLAFFSGSQSDYNKVLPIGSSIAGYKITDITAANVQLERDGKSLSVPVGGQIPLENSTEPPPAGNAPPPAESAPPSEPGASPSSPGAPNNSSNNPNDVIRQMMERRRQQMNP